MMRVGEPTTSTPTYNTLVYGSPITQPYGIPAAGGSLLVDTRQHTCSSTSPHPQPTRTQRMPRSRPPAAHPLAPLSLSPAAGFPLPPPVSSLLACVLEPHSVLCIERLREQPRAERAAAAGHHRGHAEPGDNRQLSAALPHTGPHPQRPVLKLLEDHGDGQRAACTLHMHGSGTATGTERIPGARTLHRVVAVLTSATVPVPPLLLCAMPPTCTVTEPVWSCTTWRIPAESSLEELSSASSAAAQPRPPPPSPPRSCPRPASSPPPCLRPP